MAFPVAAPLHTHWSLHSLIRCFSSRQHLFYFFARCLHARLKLKLHVCFLNCSYMENNISGWCQIIVMQFAISQNSTKHEACSVSWSSVQHTRSVEHNTNLVVLPQSTLTRRSITERQGWIGAISVFCQVSTGHISLQKIITLPSFLPKYPTSHRLGIWVTVHCTLLDCS